MSGKKKSETRKIRSLEKIRQINKVSVFYGDKKVGELAMTPTQRCAFEYDKEWLKSGFSIAPRQLDLKEGLFIAPIEPFYGNFGIFEDSLPDGYGRYLLNRILQKEGIDDTSLTPVQRLSIVGASGMGALSYVPELYIVEPKGLPELDYMQNLALEVLAEKTDKDVDVLYFNSGNSGGCRPKSLYKDEEGDWILKFRHINDPKDMGKMEYQYNKAARASGINVPDFKLIKNKYFATKRFDIEDGQRLHTATAGALLNQSIHYPALTYENLLALTGVITQDPVQVEEMFRRMVFNILAENKDDHVKNFSFYYRNAQWELAPAYDLTRCSGGYNGEHATTANGSGNPTIEDMLVVGEGIRISRKKGQEIIGQLKEVCKEILADRFKERSNK